MGDPVTLYGAVELHIDRLAIVRGDRRLFHALSFVALPGELVEIRGSNGAGKTSLLRAICGLSQVASGTISFKGAPDPAQAIHLLGHRDGLRGPLTAHAHARYWTGLLGGDAAAIGAAMQRLGLEHLADLPARFLSQGQGRRLALTRLLTVQRPIWLLDEPRAGLDDSGQIVLAELISEHRARGGTVIVATHDAPTETARAIDLDLAA